MNGLFWPNIYDFGNALSIMRKFAEKDAQLIFEFLVQRLIKLGSSQSRAGTDLSKLLLILCDDHQRKKDFVCSTFANNSGSMYVFHPSPDAKFLMTCFPSVT